MKKNALFFLMGPPSDAAEHVDQQRSDRHAGAIVEEAVGGGFGAAAIFVQRAVKLVGAGLGHQRDVGARAAAGAGVAVGGGGAELFHGIEGDAQHAGEGRARVLIVHVGAVQRDVGLIGLAAVDRAAARIEILVRRPVRASRRCVTPGWKARRPTMLRAYMGSSTMASEVITLPSEASVVLIWVAAASTWTVVVVAPSLAERDRHGGRSVHQKFQPG